MKVFSFLPLEGKVCICLIHSVYFKSILNRPWHTACNKILTTASIHAGLHTVQGVSVRVLQYTVTFVQFTEPLI